MLENNRGRAGCVRNASAAQTMIPARWRSALRVLTVLCVAGLVSPARAQDSAAPPEATPPEGISGVMQRVKEQPLLFGFLGSLLVVSTVAFILLTRKKEPASRPHPAQGGAAPSGQSPWARPTTSGANPTPPLAYHNGAGAGQTAWTPPAVVPTLSPDAGSQQAAAAQYAALHTPQSPAVSNPPLPQADPMMPASAQAVAETPIVPLGYPLAAPASRAQVDFLVSNESASPQAQAEYKIPVNAIRTDVEQTIYAGADGDRTVDEASPTLTILPGYFEIVASGDPVKDPIGTRKKLYALNSNPDFGIARPNNDQEQIANFIPLHSKRVSRSVEKQGKVVYDFQKGIYTIINFADPTHKNPELRCNPIRVEGRPLLPNEEAAIRDGDRIQVGDIMLRFHIEGRVATVGAPKTNSKKSRSGSRSAA